MFVRSKLLQTELPFSKVALILSSATVVNGENGSASPSHANATTLLNNNQANYLSGNVVAINAKSQSATVNVKFTARPRTVFHRHSDVMILLAYIKQGEQVLCSDEVELIFRGGTGLLLFSSLALYSF
jgi:hypothetical protein